MFPWKRRLFRTPIYIPIAQNARCCIEPCPSQACGNARPKMIKLFNTIAGTISKNMNCAQISSLSGSL
eukprot:9658569-Karenia_brevis.AAC.1